MQVAVLLAVAGEPGFAIVRAGARDGAAVGVVAHAEGDVSGEDAGAVGIVGAGRAGERLQVTAWCPRLGAVFVCEAGDAVPPSADSKEEIARALFAEHPVEHGIICALSVVELCMSFEYRRASDAPERSLVLFFEIRLSQSPR